MKILSGSGASTKIAFMLGVYDFMRRELNYHPDFIFGISATSLLAPFMAMNSLDKIKPIILNAKTCTIFDRRPVGRKGGISLIGAWRALRGKPSFGTQGNLEKHLRKAWDAKLHTEYKLSDAPDVFVGAVNKKTGMIQYFNIKHMDWDSSIRAILPCLRRNTSYLPFLQALHIQG